MHTHALVIIIKMGKLQTMAGINLFDLFQITTKQSALLLLFSQKDCSVICS